MANSFIQWLSWYLANELWNYRLGSLCISCWTEKQKRTTCLTRAGRSNKVLVSSWKRSFDLGQFDWIYFLFYLNWNKRLILFTRGIRFVLGRKEQRKPTLFQTTYQTAGKGFCCCMIFHPWVNEEERWSDEQNVQGRRTVQAYEQAQYSQRQVRWVRALRLSFRGRGGRLTLTTMF